MPLISIVIPVFNTANYLRECLISIQNQSFSDFEVILVDDGSTDNSGKICDEFANNDCRFKTVHQNNAGVSAARNAALDIALGDYIGFVDSDDFLLPGMLQEMSNIIKSENADIIQTEGPCEQVHSNLSNPKLLILSNEQARDEFFKIGKVRPSLWLGVYKRNLFENLRFPENIHHWEDYALIAVLVARSSKVVITSNRYYNYRVRLGSATQSPLNEKQISSLYIYDFLDSYRIFQCKQERYDVRSLFVTGICKTYVLFSPNKKYLRLIKNSIMKSFISIIKSRSIAFNRKIMMIVFIVSPDIASFFSRQYHNKLIK